MEQLEAAGIDFNWRSTWGQSSKTPFLLGWDNLLATMLAMRNEGKDTPHVVFWSGSWQADPDPAEATRVIYQHYYQPGTYNELFVYWDGKPLTCLTDLIPPEITANFTVFATNGSGPSRCAPRSYRSQC